MPQALTISPSSILLPVYTYNGEFMGERAISATLDSPSPITFAIGDYVTYRGEQFAIDYIPTAKKTGSNRFSYELKFLPAQKELYRCSFLDVVLATSNQKYTRSSQVEFYGNVEQLRDRLQANLDRMYTGGSAWTINIQPLTDTTIYKDLSVTDGTVWDALALSKSEFNLNFSVIGRTITLGVLPSSPFSEGFKFKYGKGNGLYSIDRVAQSDSAIITRLRALGGTENIPANYNRNTADEYHPELMLPGYVDSGELHTDYIDSANKSVFGVREGIYRNENIYPTMKGIRYMDVHGGVDTTPLDTLIIPENNFSTYDDGDITDTNQTYKADFTVFVRNIGFDINNYKTGEDMILSLTTGDCAGYDFVITKAVEASSTEKSTYTGAWYKLTCNRNTDDKFAIPNVNTYPQTGDNFVFLKIIMPEVYITAAENRLRADAIAQLAKIDHTKVTYAIGVDEIFMAKNSITAGFVKEGVLFPIEDSQFLINESIICQNCTIEYGNNPVPTYSVTLSDEPTVGTIGGIKTDIEEVKKEEHTTTRRSEIDARRGVKALNSLRDYTFDPDGYFDATRIKPLSIETMYLSVGARGNNFTLLATIVPNYEGDNNAMLLSQGALIHREIKWGTGELDSDYTWNIVSELMVSDIPAGEIRYIYVKGMQSVGTAEWEVSANQIKTDEGEFYHFYVGTLFESKVGGESAHPREDTFVYGKTWINGRFITTGRIRSLDGNNYIDLDHNQMRLGNNTNYIDWGVTTPNALTVHGAIIQKSEAQDDGGNAAPIVVDRGEFSLDENPYYPGNITTFEGSTYYCHTTTIGKIIPLNTAYFRVYSEKGVDGVSPISGHLTNESCNLPATSDGVVSDYTKAQGFFKVSKGGEDVTEYCTFEATPIGCTGSIVPTKPIVHDWADGIAQGNFDTSANWQELSGLTASYKSGNENYLWVLSDSPANMFAAASKLDASNKGVWSLVGTPSMVDWEDIESGLINGIPYLYIFDFGNNSNALNSRGAGIDMVIHRVIEPKITGSNGSTTEYISISCVFPSANLPTHRDCEAAIIDPATGDIFIITKRESIPGVYKLSYQDNYTGIQTLSYMGKMYDIPDATTLALGSTACNVVDASINKSGTELIVKNYADVYVFLRDPATQTVFQALQGTPTVMAGYVGGGSATPAKSHPNAEPQGEGICFDELGVDIYSHSEYATGSSAGNFPLFRYSRLNGTPGSVAFQDGTSPLGTTYVGTLDTYIWDTNPTTSYGAEATFFIDNVDASETGRRKGLLKFDIESLGAPKGTIVVGARLDFNIAVEGQGFKAYKMLTPWDETSTYTSLGGITPDGVKASVDPDFVNGINLDGVVGILRNNVPLSTVQGWLDDPSTNNGWMFDAADSATGDGVQISSREDTTVSNRPKLTIRYVYPQDIAGSYNVTSIPDSTDEATLKLKATYEGSVLEKSFSVGKAKAGVDGAGGLNARYVLLTATANAVVFNSAGNLVSPANSTLTASAYNFVGTPYYEFFVNDAIQGAPSTTPTKVLSFSALTYASMPLKVEVNVREGSSTGTVIARDQISIIGIMPGSSGISVVLSNQSHTLPSDNAGNILSGGYSGSGTTIEVYEGAAKLQFNTVIGNSRFVISKSASNITAGATSGSGTNTCTIANHSAFLADSNLASVTFTIIVQKADGAQITLTAIQTLTKSKMGATGLTGADAPLFPNRGVWVADETYVGNAARQDLVQYSEDGTWYKASPSAGTFTDSAWVPSHWVSFGYSGESVATKLLLANYANLAGFIFYDNKLISQDGYISTTLAASSDPSAANFVPKIKIDAINKEITIASVASVYTPSGGITNVLQTVSMDSDTGELIAKSGADQSRVTSHGIVSSGAGMMAVDPAVGRYIVSGIIGKSQGNLAKDLTGIRAVCGVYGGASNSNADPAPTYGGYFDKVRANGITFGSVVINSDTTLTTNLSEYDSMVISTSNALQNIYLPTDVYIGTVIYVRQWQIGTARVFPPSGAKLYDDSSENSYRDIANGQMVMFTFIGVYGVDPNYYPTWLMN